MSWGMLCVDFMCLGFGEVLNLCIGCMYVFWVIKFVNLGNEVISFSGIWNRYVKYLG